MDQHPTTNWKKYGFRFVILILVLFTAVMVVMSDNIVGSLIGYAIMWGIGLLVWRMWKPASEWMSSEIPLRQWLAERKEQKSAEQSYNGPAQPQPRRTVVMDRDNNPDTEGWTGMTPQQEEEWQNILKHNFRPEGER